MTAAAPEVMPADVAEQIRELVWTKAMRKTFGEVPGFYLMCACQSGLTHWCQIGNHGKCHRAEPLPAHETSVLKRGGTHPAQFDEPLFHRTPTATGGHRMCEAQVWLADRVCAWRCPCEYHNRPPERTSRPVQLGLFAVPAA